MAILTANVAPMMASADLAPEASGSDISTTATLSASANVVADQGTTGRSSPLVAVGLLTAEADVYKGAKGSSSSGFIFKLRGSLYVINKTVPVYAPATGVVDNIEDLPVSPPANAVYEVRGTASNRQPITAIWDDINDVWVYQPILSGRNTNRITYLNTTIGTYLTMPDYINYNGVAHTPLYWDKSTLDSTFAYSLIDIIDPEVQAVPPSGYTVWRWKVDDLADPGTGQYSLNSWPEHSGGPTWYSKSFYRPQVKGTVKFNNKKNKTRKQRSVTFTPGAVDHMWMQYPAGLSQPFTVVVVGIIHSYPTAKFGHYILDTANETPIFDANKTGKDFFFDEGATPRQAMLYMKKTARMTVNNYPADDMKDHTNIKIKHTEKARPRMFYGVFNGSSSRFGARDIKSKYEGTGTLDNLGAHKYFSIGRRVNRVSDNRASHMSIWEIVIAHAALSKAQIDGIYEEMSNYYQFKEYS